MKKMLCVAMFLTLTGSVVADNETNTVLSAADFESFEIVTMYKSSWVYGFENGENLEVEALRQDFFVNGINCFIKYGELPSVEIAQQVITNHVADVAVIFIQGMWAEANQPQMGDGSWYFDCGSYISILFSSEATCVLLSCYYGDETTTKNLCEQLALKIVEKVGQGGHVIIPDDIHTYSIWYKKLMQKAEELKQLQGEEEE